MEIKDFTDTHIRLGEFPFCIDVSNIPNSHSSNGLLCNLYTYNLDKKEKQRIMLIQNSENNQALSLIVLRFESQWEELPEEVKNGKILFDSYQSMGN